MKRIKFTSDICSFEIEYTEEIYSKIKDLQQVKVVYTYEGYEFEGLFNIEIIE
jgi:hypothetical protein